MVWKCSGSVCLALLLFTAALCGEQRPAACNWNAYHPVKFGTPPVGGHDRLATVKVVPTYPPAARQKGVRGKVTSEVLIDRSGNVVKTCSIGEPVLVKAADEAMMKWKFVKNFGIVSEHPERGPRFAVLSFTFDFDPEADDRKQR